MDTAESRPPQHVREALLLVNGQVATDREGAKRFLGDISDDRFDAVVKTCGLVRLGRDWYAYTDLAQAVDVLRARRAADRGLRPTIEEEPEEDGKKAGKNRGPTAPIGGYRTPVG